MAQRATNGPNPILVAEVVGRFHEQHEQWPRWLSVQIRLVERFDLTPTEADTLICDAIRGDDVYLVLWSHTPDAQQLSRQLGNLYLLLDQETTDRAIDAYLDAYFPDDPEGQDETWEIWRQPGMGIGIEETA